MDCEESKSRKNNVSAIKFFYAEFALLRISSFSLFCFVVTVVVDNATTVYTAQLKKDFEASSSRSVIKTIQVNVPN